MEILKIIGSWLYLRRLRRKIDPVAEAFGIESSTVIGKFGCLVHYYKFKDGNWITLTVWRGGFNLWSPDWQSGYEKNTEGFDLLMKVIMQAKNG